MTPTELIVILIFVPALVFFVWRQGVMYGGINMLSNLHVDGYLTKKAEDDLELTKLETTK